MPYKSINSDRLRTIGVGVGVLVVLLVCVVAVLVDLSEFIPAPIPSKIRKSTIRRTEDNAMPVLFFTSCMKGGKMTNAARMKKIPESGLVNNSLPPVNKNNNPKIHPKINLMPILLSFFTVVFIYLLL